MGTFAVRPLRCTLLGLGCSLLVGCGSSDYVKIHGLLTLAGKPIPMKPDARMQVRFYPVALYDPTELPVLFYHADLGEEGAYAVPGRYGKGIPRGNYRVSVQVLTPSGADLLESKYSPNASPLRCQADLSGQMQFDIELTNAVQEQARETEKKSPQKKYGPPRKAS